MLIWEIGGAVPISLCIAKHSYFDFIAAHGSCGGTFEAQSGTLSSPNYPGDYEGDLDCKYFIDVDGILSKITVSFINFDLESIGIKVYDYLEYGVGSSTSSNKLGVFYGSETPPDFEIETNSALWFRFISDENNFKPHGGFSLSWVTGK